MDKRLKGRNIEDWIAKHPLTAMLKTHLKNGLIEVDGKVFLAKFYKKRGGSNEDATGAEMWVNGFHIDLYVPKEKVIPDYSLQQGLTFAFSLKDLLINQFPGTAFKIIVSTDEGEDAFPEVCTVGFHKVRSNEVWLLGNLEGYKMNGLLVITT